MAKRALVSFDWAIKKLLRSKANFDVLEGFLSELLKEDVQILEILESESNQESMLDKQNRVDLKARLSGRELVIIEVQYERQYDFFHRMLFGASKALTEHLSQGMDYSEIRKIISVGIVWFDLGQGSDYVYHGTTQFMGLHNQDVLRLSPAQQELYGTKGIQDLFPEYWLLRINEFNDVSKDSLDEWIYFLKNERIQGNVPAKGLERAQEVLDLMNMSAAERAEYEAYIHEMRCRNSESKSNFIAGKLEGHQEGHKEGLQEGIEKGLQEGIEKGAQQNALETARKLRERGFSKSEIQEITGLELD